MKLICLKSHLGTLALTEGKVYDAIDSDGFAYYMNANYWRVINDDNIIMNYTKNLNIFLDLAEWREKQINSILDDEISK